MENYKEDEVLDENRPRTIEHHNDFRVVCRLGKIVAPDFYIACSDRFQEHTYLLDLITKRIELSAHSDVPTVIAGALISLGHVLHKRNPKFYDVFNPHKVPNGDDGLYHLSKLSESLDKKALKWASFTLFLVFPHLYTNTLPILKSYCWTQFEWRKYYSDEKINI